MHPRVQTAPSPLRRASLAFAFVFAACALCATATFADAPPSTSTPDEPVAATPSTSGDRTIVKIVRIEGTDAETDAVAPRGMVAVRDAETGELRAPTAAEWSKLSANFDPLNRSAAGLEEVHFADGTVSVRLDGRFQSMSTVQRAEDGSLHAGCTHRVEALSHFVSDEPADATESVSSVASSEEVRDVR